MAESFNDRYPAPDEEAARAYRAQFEDDQFPKCQVCQGDIELFLDLYHEFDNTTLYWGHMGIIPQHKAMAGN